MPKTNEDLTKHTLYLYAGDYERLRAYAPDLGAAVIIRRIVHQWIEKVEAEAGGEQPNVTIKI